MRQSTVWVLAGFQDSFYCRVAAVCPLFPPADFPHLLQHRFAFASFCIPLPSTCNFSNKGNFQRRNRNAMTRLHVQHPRPPSLRGIYRWSISALGWSAPYAVNNFRVWLSKFRISAMVHLIISKLYWMTGTAKDVKDVLSLLWGCGWPSPTYFFRGHPTKPFL